MSDNEEAPARHGAGAGDEHSSATPDSSTEMSFGESFGDVNSLQLTEDEETWRNAMYQSAIDYQERGFRVIPLYPVDDAGNCACGSEEDHAAGKHPVDREWQKPEENAHEDRRWWRELNPSETIPADWRPRANIGILTGAHSGFFVVDIDPVAGGDIMWEQVCASHPADPIPPTRIIKTGSGGRHYYFRMPDFDLGNPKPWGKTAGIDIKGTGGYVVAPPSVSARGGYEVIEDLPPAAAPQWLLDKLRERARAQAGEITASSQPVAPAGVLRRYMIQALKGNAQRVRDAGEHNRNNELNEQVFRLGRLGAHGYLTENEARLEMIQAGMDAGLGYDECFKTFNSAWFKGLLEPADLSGVGATDHEWPLRPWTGFGLGDRMVDWWGDVLRWDADRKAWYFYAGGLWGDQPEELGSWLGQEMIRNLPETEAQGYDSGEDHGSDDDYESPRDKFVKWVQKQSTTAAAAEASKACRAHPVMQMRITDLDTDPWLMNVQNGVIDLRRAVLAEHSPDQRMSLQARTRCDRDALRDPLAAAPAWAAFLERVQPDPELRAYLQRQAGYSCYGAIDDQVIFLSVGTGANGKSVFYDTLLSVLGSYSQVIPSDTLMDSKADRIPNDVARMRGKRLLFASETKAGKAINEQRVKSLSGDGTIAARFLRAEWFEFEPTGKPHLATNFLPKLSDSDAMWRRVHLTKWDVRIPDDEQERGLARRLYAEEAPGILAWLVQGCLMWQREGLSPPEAALAHKSAYREDQDEIRRFAAECLALSPGNHLPKDVVFATYKGWCQAQGIEHSKQAKTFHDAMSERGVQIGKCRTHGPMLNKHVYFDLALVMQSMI